MAWTEELTSWMDTISSPYQAEDGTIYTQDYIQSADGSTRWYRDGRTEVIRNDGTTDVYDADGNYISSNTPVQDSINQTINNQDGNTGVADINTPENMLSGISDSLLDNNQPGTVGLHESTDFGSNPTIQNNPAQISMSTLNEAWASLPENVTPFGLGANQWLSSAASQSADTASETQTTGETVNTQTQQGSTTINDPLGGQTIGALSGALTDAASLDEQNRGRALDLYNDPTVYENNMAEAAFAASGGNILRGENDRTTSMLDAMESANIENQAIRSGLSEQASSMNNLTSALGSAVPFMGQDTIGTATGREDTQVNETARTLAEAINNTFRSGSAPEAVVESGGGGTHICYAYEQMGYITKTEYNEYMRYAIRKIDIDTYRGYAFWAKPLSRVIMRNSLIRTMLWPFAESWMSHMRGHNNILGFLLMLIGKPVCLFFGKLIKGESYV